MPRKRAGFAPLMQLQCARDAKIVTVASSKQSGGIILAVRAIMATLHRSMITLPRTLDMSTRHVMQNDLPGLHHTEGPAAGPWHS